jgi:hypothetical protein
MRSEEDREEEDALARIAAALRGLRYGTVTAVVQDGLVVQVERTEKIRILKREPSSASSPPRPVRGPT